MLSLFLATINQFLSPARQAHPLALFFWNLVIKPVFLHREARLAQHLGIVAAELAHMVVLAEEALAFLRVGNCRVFEGVDIGVDGHEENRPTARLQD